MRRILIVAALLAAIPLQNLRAQQGNIAVFIDPTLLDDLYNEALIDAVKSAFLVAPFMHAAKPGNGILMINELERPKFHQDTIQFSVGFFRDGIHLADSIETCTIKKVSDCSDQLASDAKDAAAIQK